MPQLKKGSKKAKDYMAKIRAMKGTKKVGAKKETYSQSANKYKFFILEKDKITSGWEFKSDAMDELENVLDYTNKAKVITLAQAKNLKLYDTKLNKEYSLLDRFFESIKVKRKLNGYYKGSTRFVEQGEKPVKNKTNYRVDRNDTTLLTKGGTFKKFTKVIAGLFDTSVLKDIDELKKEYFRLAQIYHPDKGGTTEQFQNLQSEYIKYRNALINGSSLSSEQKTNEMDLDNALMQVVNQISGLVGINIELVGKWIWVSGNTYPIRTELKNAGFLFASTKKMWYYKGTESSGRGNLTMEEIRNKYGSQKIEPKGQSKLNGIGKITTTQKSKLKTALKKVAKALDKRAI